MFITLSLRVSPPDGRLAAVASQAAYLIDGKVEFKYIEPYIIVNKLVQISAGSFYFVKRPDYIATTSQFKTNLIKGAMVQIITLDPRYNIYVKFNSKGEVSEFLGGVARLALLRPDGRKKGSSSLR